MVQKKKDETFSGIGKLFLSTNNIRHSIKTALGLKLNILIWKLLIREMQFNTACIHVYRYNTLSLFIYNNVRVITYKLYFNIACCVLNLPSLICLELSQKT